MVRKSGFRCGTSATASVIKNTQLVLVSMVFHKMFNL